ncbi:G patch domain-containing protein 1 homolog [Culex quinquefasciatus]|uniref:G patch domain-containing protein 1 homolog n=1 Tax=Culex quinquefasciatus TaxID=7176 RepID=UPI0018E2EA27|nr:G patch domain-containing protein 1 homolog [Culex quinquefasciatus]
MEEDDDTLCKYGTPLPTYEQDEIPAKKPVSVEDQIVLDANGKRRFHGAFTGGFSAGYWNTVGSQEGWKPAEFKSSRAEKASARAAQNPMDFMDDEDLGEFGIAPQRVQTRDDFAAAGSSKGGKRRAPVWSGGPIPGQPVLKALLEPAREKTAVAMLKRMGWREGQGIGERQSRGEKKKARERNRKETYVMKMYGCEIPGRGSPKGVVEVSDSESDESEDYEVSFAPDDFDPLVAAIKDNTFGLGYSGLDRGSGSGAKRFNLFETLEIVDRNNKKLSIRGQAFGVGALEDDDEDIYAKDDMSRYDFSLEDRAKKPAAIKSAEQAGVLDGFCASKKTGKQMKKVFKVRVPENFTPRNWTQRKSRFEPMEEDRAERHAERNQYKVQGLGRHDLNPEQRGQALGEVPLPVIKEPPKNPILEMINQRAQNFVAGEVINSDQDKPPSVAKKDPLKFDLKAETSNLGSTREGFKPFIADPDKQERYEKFLSFKPCEKYKTKQDFLDSLQPLGMSPWDRERESKEFAQAQRMYRPLDGLMSDRFVTESNLIAEKEVADANKSVEVRVKRTRGLWKPHKDLCKRFNVPEPFGGMLEEEKTVSKTKFSVFDYLEAPVNSRKDFVTPVVIPKQFVTKDDAKPVRAAAKDFFAPPPTPTPQQEPSTSRVKPAPPPPKKPEKLTPLEQQVLDSVNKKPEEKKDLFKSIFCSSDEEEDASDSPPEPTPSTEADKLKLVESLVAIKPASEVNVLRNNSPPRGIFASIFDIQKSASVNRPQSVDSSSSSDEEDDAYYGPKLPQGVGARVASASKGEESAALDARLKEMMQKVGSRDVVEEWVEKGNSGSSSKGRKKKHKEHKKSKKHKKEKKKHKHKERK